MGAESGFSAVFELLLLFPVLLVVSWFPELRNPNSPILPIKGPVWAAVLLCLGILSGALVLLRQSK